MNYFKNKIETYKQQDRKAGRELNLDNYFDVEWCMDRLNGTCGKCGCDFCFETKKGNINSCEGGAVNRKPFFSAKMGLTDSHVFYMCE